MSKLIQWPRAQYWDKPWNPIIGCKPCSPACEHCYAAAWAKRFGQSFEPHQSSQTRPPRKGVVFCGNMTDLFGERLYCGEMASYIQAANGFSDAIYLWLTKRVRRMASALDYATRKMSFCVDDSPHYFGFTAENQEWYEKRLQLRAASAPMFPDWANLWVSCEPLLGPIDLGLIFCGELVKPVYKWVVVGCESGPNRRPCKIEWVESIVEQCLAANVSVFVKQLDIGGKCVTDINKFPKHLQIRQVPWTKKGETKK